MIDPNKYDQISIEVKKFSTNYRLSHQIPQLPTDDELLTVWNPFAKNNALLVTKVQEHVAKVDPDPGHGYEHLQWVASLAGFIATQEIDDPHLIEAVMKAGLLHDIERHLGFGEDHMVEGAHVAETILAELGYVDPDIISAVRNHDHLLFDTGNNQRLQLIYGCLFDADHFRYGLEREDTFWQMKQKKGKPAREVIHDYHYLYQYQDAWQTTYGKNIGPQLLDYGLAIATHIEETFQNKF